MNNLILISFRGVGSARNEYPDYIIAIAFFTPLILGIAYLIYLNVKNQNRKWAKGIFPDKLPFNRDNLLEAYICLAARIIQKDRRDSKEKIAYLNTYFLKYFKENTYNFGDSLSWSFKNPVEPKTVAFWINRHVKEETKRMQILYFLVGLSFVDGQLVNGEYTILKEITPLLNLNLNDLDSIVNMYIFDEEKKKATNTQSSIGTLSKAHKKEIALKILGLAQGANHETIKNAYRKLVKIHHPDRFSNESNQQQALAHEKFLKIQEAYEFLIGN